jgi:hypothetical protein
MVMNIRPLKRFCLHFVPFGMLMHLIFLFLILQEDGICLTTVIKGTCKYRRSRRHEFVTDFLPPSTTELKYVCDQVIG